MAAHQFCSDLSHARGEPLVGTGDIDAEMLLITWPRGKWRIPRSESVGMSQAIGDAIVRAYDTRTYITLVDGPGGPDELPTLWCFPQNVRIEARSEAELVAAIDAWATGRPIEGGIPETRLTVTCCTDGKVDACCARKGFSTFKALQAAADPARFNVLQSVHIGGCRLASSLAVPSRRQRYGRLTPDDVPAFLESLEAGAIYLPAYRGNATLPELEQTAELAAMRWAAKAGRPSADVALAAPVPAGALTEIGAEVAGARLTIRLEARDFLMHGGCDELAPVLNPPELTRRWLVREVLPQSL